MPRPSNTDERREQIVGALVKVMAKHGYDGASIADIAKAARLTPGLVHYHFKSKQEILLGALHQLVSQHEERIAAALAPVEDDPAAAIAALIDLHLGLGTHADPPALACWILLSGEALRQPKVRVEFEKALESLVAHFASAIERGRAQRIFKCESAATPASALVAAIQGYFVLAATAREVIPRGSAAIALKQMADGLLRPTRPFGERKVRA
jgi:TetR/AcrR family transcriptional repressor of bet genes